MMYVMQILRMMIDRAIGESLWPLFAAHVKARASSFSSFQIDNFPHAFLTASILQTVN